MHGPPARPVHFCFDIAFMRVLRRVRRGLSGKTVSLTQMTTNSESNSPNPGPVSRALSVPLPPAREVEAAPSQELPPSAIRSFLANRGSGRIADRAFAGLMLVCACSIFAIVIFIATILVLRSKLSIAQFGFKFFTSQSWDPVSGDFGALPFIFGTLATSFLALCMAVPLGLGVAVFLTELCPRVLRAPDLLSDRVAGGDSQRGLRALGCVCTGAHHARFAWALPAQDAWLDRIFRRRELWRGTADGEHHSGNHDSSNHLVAYPGHYDRSAEHAARGCAGSGRNAVGDDPHWAC